MDDEEDLFIKYNVPDEIIGKIISFVPSKKNCSLVNKTFHRESIKATRNKCLLILDRYVISDEGFINVQWAFNEVVWHGCCYEYPKPVCGCLSYYTQSKQFFEKFGSRVEKLSINRIETSKSALLEMLSLMPNLNELHIGSVNCSINDRFGPSQPQSIELPKLKKILFTYDDESLLDFILCPSLQTFYWIKNDTKFLHHQKHLTDIKVLGIGNQTLEHLSRLKLTTLRLFYSVEASQGSALIESQPQLSSLEMYVSNEVELETLRRVVSLQRLESLRIRFGSFFSIPEQLVHNIMQMSKLKKLALNTPNGYVFKVMNNAKHLQFESLESLKIRTLLDCSKQEFQQLPSVLPKLKDFAVDGFKGNPKFFMGFKKLESLNIKFGGEIIDDECTELGVNMSVRVLKAVYSPSLLTRLIRMMPNIERIKIKQNYSDKNSFDIVTVRKLFKEVLSLKNLVEIECLNEFLLDEGVIDCIKNCTDSSKLHRIRFSSWGDNWQSLVAAYEDKFIFRRTDFEKKKITLSRF